MSLSKPATDYERLGLSFNDGGNYGLEDYSAQTHGGSMVGAGAASANPYVLAATVGLALMQQQAADARAKREREASIVSNQASNESNILGNLNNSYGRALLR